jgi:hypothetical protein
MAIASSIDLSSIADALAAHGVAYVLVGSAAASLHGAGREAPDIDIVVEWSTANLARLDATTAGLGARRSDDGDWDYGRPSGLIGEVRRWWTPAGRIDAFDGQPAGRSYRRYRALAADATGVAYDGREIPVAELQAVIAAKTWRGSWSDRAAITELEALLPAINTRRIERESATSFR